MSNKFTKKVISTIVAVVSSYEMLSRNIYLAPRAEYLVKLLEKIPAKVSNMMNVLMKSKLVNFPLKFFFPVGIIDPI